MRSGPDRAATADLSQPGVNAGLTELSRSECLALLAAGNFGRLVVTTPGGRPLIRPVNYAFDQRSQSVIFRTDRGAKLSALLHHARACFEIDAFDPADGEAWSVIITGVTEQITQPVELARLDHLDIQPWAPGEHPYWVRIRARIVSGRRIQSSR
jgi:nitroimidazol reductase NimA-like FMN-containing flavoprotein (pyridoxamine 5'-phosphate oxidase superfamily)